MPEQEAPGGQQEQQQTPAQTPGGQQEPEVFDKAYVESLRQENAKYRSQRNEFKSELDKAREKSMTPDEKALNEARQEGRLEATRENAQNLARTAFDAAAGRRNPQLPDKDLSEIADNLNWSRFVSEDGKVDQDAIRKAAERLVPAPDGKVPDFDGGQNGGAATPADMNTRIRKMAGFSR